MAGMARLIFGVGLLVLVALGLPSTKTAGAAATRVDMRPNIIYFLTDDQDMMLGGLTPMKKARILLAEQGASAENFFVHTPICNPSRGSLLTGRYFHNIKRTGGRRYAMHVDEDQVSETTFARSLKERGNYTVGLFGKYLTATMQKEVAVSPLLPPTWVLFHRSPLPQLF